MRCIRGSLEVGKLGSREIEKSVDREGRLGTFGFFRIAIIEEVDLRKEQNRTAKTR